MTDLFQIVIFSPSFYLVIFLCERNNKDCLISLFCVELVHYYYELFLL